MRKCLWIVKACVKQLQPRRLCQLLIQSSLNFCGFPSRHRGHWPQVQPSLLRLWEENAGARSSTLSNSAAVSFLEHLVIVFIIWREFALLKFGA